MDPLRFLNGRRKRRLKRLWLSCLLALVFQRVCCDVNYGVVLFSVISVFCLLFVLVRLSVSVQVIDRKDSSPK